MFPNGKAEVCVRKLQPAKCSHMENGLEQKRIGPKREVPVISRPAALLTFL